MKNNMVSWFEIPVNDMEKAISFYEKVFDIKLERHLMGEDDMAWFPMVEDGPGAPGSLVKNPDFYIPSIDGPLIYLTAPSGDLSNELARVEPAGGKVVQDKKQISEEYGYMAVIMDTEGNRLALHSMK